jgi:citrate lyase subunit beta/citryl-CoA lyase
MMSATEARSLLFVPGTRSDRFDRAATSGADAVILDLEDSVAPSAKLSARDEVRIWLTGPARPAEGVVVRVNGVGTAWHVDDLRMAATVGCAVLLPKADTVEGLVAVRAALPAQRQLVALIETARGVRDVAELCGSGLIDRVAFGSVDFTVELGLDPTRPSPTLTHARSALVVASAAAGLQSPLDGVTTAVDDPYRLAVDLEDAVSAGFGGKLAIHPRQVIAINQAWTPAPALVSWAERVIAACAHEVGVTTVDGQMVDLPVIMRARRTLALANTPRTTGPRAN